MTKILINKPKISRNNVSYEKFLVSNMPVELKDFELSILGT